MYLYLKMGMQIGSSHFCNVSSKLGALFLFVELFVKGAGKEKNKEVGDYTFIKRS